MTDCDNMLHNFQLHTLINIHIDRVTRNMRFAQAYKIRKRPYGFSADTVYSAEAQENICTCYETIRTDTTLDLRDYKEVSMLNHNTYILTSIAQ